MEKIRSLNGTYKVRNGIIGIITIILDYPISF